MFLFPSFYGAFIYHIALPPRAPFVPRQASVHYYCTSDMTPTDPNYPLYENVSELMNLYVNRQRKQLATSSEELSHKALLLPGLLRRDPHGVPEGLQNVILSVDV